MGNETYTIGKFYRSRAKREGVGIEVFHGGKGFTEDFLTSINSEFNSSDIYVDYFDIGNIGGLGGPGVDLIELINSVEDPLKIFIGQIVLGVFSNFVYDKLKDAILKVLKKSKPDSGNHPVEIHHHTKIVVFNFNIDKTTEEDLDLQLRTLLSDVILEENLEYDPELVRKIYDKYAQG